MYNAFFCLEREAEILKPLASVEVVEKTEANFETEISEDDVVGEWKLQGQVLTRSPVMPYSKLHYTIWSLNEHSDIIQIRLS